MESAKSLYGQPWSKRELVITLHYYFLNRNRLVRDDSGYVHEVALLLGRTPASIRMRMENFASLDQQGKSAQRGLANGGPRCREIFLRWKDRLEELRAGTEFLLDEQRTTEPDLFSQERLVLPMAFQKYEMHDHIGDGGFGSVFSCVDTHCGKAYAIKILRAEDRFDKQKLHRFFREIRILRSFRHEHVIRLHEENLESEQAFPAFVMDLADCSLTQYFGELKEEGRTRPYLERNVAATTFRAMCSAVRALHMHSPRIIHRDINPNNILLLPSGTWVLADFSLSKFISTPAIASSFVTNTRRLGGTTFYAAPEQYDNFVKTDERTDIFALGMLLWELFTKASGSAWPQMAEPELPQGLDSVFKKAVEREQAARYQTVDEMLADYERALIIASSGSSGKAAVP